MLKELLAHWLKTSNPERLRTHVYLAQIVVGSLFVLGFAWSRKREAPSGFRTRESELRKRTAQFRSAHEKDELGDALLVPRSQPLRLSGIVLNGAPHEVLGIAPSASDAEIQKSYRDLMKRFHPDVVGRPGTREWKDAQAIATAIHQAREKMLAAIRSRKK